MIETNGQKFRRYVREIDSDMVSAWRSRPSKWRSAISAPFVFGALVFSCGLLLLSWLVME